MREKEKKILFFCFHYLKRKDDYKRIWGHSFSDFKSYISFLESRGYVAIGFSQFDIFFRGQGDIPDKSFVLSFDDGLYEHANVFAPYLSKKKISGVFSIPTCILDGEMTCIQIIHFLTAKYGIRKFYKFIKEYFHVTGLDWNDYFYDIDQSVDLLDFYKYLKNKIINELPPKESNILLHEIAKNILIKADKNIFSKVYMSKEDIVYLSNSGHEIAGHTHYHKSFKNFLVDKDEWSSEVLKSKKNIDELINKKTMVFSYPFGGKKEDFSFWADNLKKIGYEYALNAYKDNKSESGILDPFWIQRYSVQSLDSPDDMFKKACEYII